MFSTSFTGLDLIARYLDISAGRIGYLVLERPNSRHENVRVARVNFDAESLRDYMPTAADLARRLPGPFGGCSPLAEAAVGWLRAQMERSLGFEHEATFKVNAWQHKGVALEFAPRVVARRTLGPGKTRGALSTQASFSSASDCFLWLFILATTQGAASINEQIARAEGRLADAEREAATARACLQIAVSLCGHADHAAKLGPPPGPTLARLAANDAPKPAA